MKKLPVSVCVGITIIRLSFLLAISMTLIGLAEFVGLFKMACSTLTSCANATGLSLLYTKIAYCNLIVLMSAVVFTSWRLRQVNTVARIITRNSLDTISVGALLRIHCSMSTTLRTLPTPDGWCLVLKTSRGRITYISFIRIYLSRWRMCSQIYHTKVLR